MDKKQTEALRIATESLPMLKIAASLGDETGQISFHSSHLLNLIEGYAAARQEIASLTAQPYDQQAMGLCHACGWKGVIDYPDGPVCVACEHDKTLSPQPAAQPLHVAATSCPHEIDKDKIVLHFDSKQPGKNALAQLAARLQAAQAAPAQAAVPADLMTFTSSTQPALQQAHHEEQPDDDGEQGHLHQLGDRHHEPDVGSLAPGQVDRGVEAR